MSRWRSLLLALALVLAAGAVQAQNRYGWTISASSSNPLVNFTPPTSGVRTVYLWFNCATLDGMTAAEFDLSAQGSTILEVTPQNGFINAGGTLDLLLAVGGCPSGPMIAAELLILDAPGTICLVPSASGTKATLDCQPCAVTLYPIDWIGYSTDDPPCEKGLQCPVDAVEGASWGEAKGLYRGAR